MTGSRESTWSIEAASSRPSTEVIDLGRRLIAELNLDRSCETLSKWLARLLAEKISSWENAEDADAKKRLEEQAVGLILQLWQHRYSGPSTIRPFASLEKVVDFLGSLSTEHEDSYAEFRAMMHPSSDWEQLMRSIETLRSKAVPLLALTEMAFDASGQLLEWEESNQDVLEPLEVTAVQLFRAWLTMLEDETELEGQEDANPNFVTDTPERRRMIISIVEKYVEHVQASLNAFKSTLACALPDTLDRQAGL